MKHTTLNFRVDEILKERDLSVREFVDRCVLDFTFKFRVDEILKKKKISIADFARDAGIHYNTALSISNGNYKRIGLDTLAQMCNGLNVKLNDLFVREELPHLPGAKPGLHYNTGLAIVNRNYKRVGLDTLAQMCNGLNVEIGELLYWEK